MAEILNITSDEYHARPEVSVSDLKSCWRDPRKFHAIKTGRRQRDEPTPSMLWGLDLESFWFTGELHNAVAKPTEFDGIQVPKNATVLMDELSAAVEIPADVLSEKGHKIGKRYNEWKKLQADNAILLTAAEIEERERKLSYVDWLLKNEGQRVLTINARESRIAEFREVKTQIESSAAAVKYLQGDYHPVILWEYDGVAMRSELDVLGREGETVFITDLKSCSSVKAREFASDAAKFWYHVQAFAYREAVTQCFSGWSVPAVRFVCVQNSPSYQVEVYKLDDQFMALGKQVFEEALRFYVECAEYDDWRSSTHGDVTTIEAPGYAKRSFEEWESIASD